MKESAAVVALVPAGVVTVTSTAPALPAGVIAVIWVAPLTVKAVAGAAPNMTEVAPVRAEPVIVTGSRDLRAVLERLFARDIRHVFVEGGPTLASAFVAAGLVDEYLVYLAPALLGGDRAAITDVGVATIADARRLTIQSLDRIGEDVVIVARPDARGASSNPQEEK